MNRMTALLSVPLVISLAACSGGKGGDQASSQQAKSPQVISTPTAGTATPEQPVASRTMGAAPQGAEQATVKFTKCKVTPSGVEMEAQVTNTTKDKRTFIITGLAYAKDKKLASSAALMVQGLGAGATEKATGKSASAPKGNVTCEAGEINSMPVG